LLKALDQCPPDPLAVMVTSHKQAGQPLLPASQHAHNLAIVCSHKYHLRPDHLGNCFLMRRIRRAGILEGSQKWASCCGWRKVEIEGAVRIGDESTYGRRVALAVVTDGEHIVCLLLVEQPDDLPTESIGDASGSSANLSLSACKCQPQQQKR